MESIPPEVAERAAIRHTVNAEGCWITTYAIQPTGYAYIAWQGRTNGGKIVSVPVHRAAYQHAHGEPPRPDGQVDHVCHNPDVCQVGDACPHRACVRGDHLVDGPVRDNALRANSRAARNAQKAACPTCGGEYTREYRADGSYIGRRCVPCRNARSRERYHRSGDRMRAYQREHHAHTRGR